MAEQLGIFLGTMIGSMIKHAGPTMQTFLVGVIREALSDRNEVSTANSSVQSIVDGVLRKD